MHYVTWLHFLGGHNELKYLLVINYKTVNSPYVVVDWVYAGDSPGPCWVVQPFAPV